MTDRPETAGTPALAAVLAAPGSPWRDLKLVAETGSTNADLAELARSGGPAGTVLVADYQSGGRGRLDRTWTAPPRTCLMVSVLVRPTRELAAWSWLPLLTGLAAAGAVQAVTGLAARVKWPNDVLIGDRKLAGILTEIVDAAGTEPACVIGMGLNTGMAADQLPVPTATSLLVEGADVSRMTVLAAFLDRLGGLLGRWADPAADAALREEYLAVSATVGRPVRVEYGDGRELAGLAIDVDAAGRLLVRGEDGTAVPVAAGDVVHARR